jgi:2-polyprenyl-6-methoxyphenol hydroxylase-like FAD-dependent oxidoreductase
VIGASVAGMSTARVLADHFERVTVVERDAIDGDEFRPGVPQGRQVHALLRGGSEVLERLFPGFEAQLLGRGARSVYWAREIRWWHFGGWKGAHDSEFASVACSRFLVEDTIRRRLREWPIIEFVDGVRVETLIADEERNSVRGVRLDDGRVLEADLVVDASGRSSRAPEWLRALGFNPPAETVVTSFLGYASRLYRRPTRRIDWTGLLIYPTPPKSNRGGVIFPIEGDRWHVILVGVGREYPPTDPDEFMAFAKSLLVPDLHKAIVAAEPLSPIYGYRNTENRLRHFDRLPRYLERFVVLGDAACCFNPVYGQGMTTAALSAELLGSCIRQAKGGPLMVARTFQRRLGKLLSVPWTLATSEDFRYPTTEGGRATPLTRMLQRYVDGVIRLGVRDVAAYDAFWQVLHMCKPPASLLAPRLLMRVLAGIAASRRSPSAESEPPSNANHLDD